MISKRYSFKEQCYDISASRKIHEKLENDVIYFEAFIGGRSAEATILAKGTSEVQEAEGVGNTGFTWTRSNTLLLISEYTRLSSQFRDPKVKKRTLWTQIKSAFAITAGVDVSEEALDRKWRNLKKTYTSCKENKNATGRGRIAWEHYEQFEEIYQHDRTINLPKMISSSTAMNVNVSSVEDQITASPSIDDHDTPRTARTLQAKKMSSLYKHRKRKMDLEEKRVEEIRLLRQAIEESNTIQRERNEILRNMVEK